MAERAGRLDFFPPHSPYPCSPRPASPSSRWVVYGLWLFLTAAGVLLAGVLGLVFQYVQRAE
ncbi:cytochrome c oxidase subunit 4 [Streptomyces cinnamoneus]|uniref:aa3-type cytochrome oxidase subunit IV n=1 Tax=Streptomyces cinnamoneus TaxID=53446 RepID=UPI0026D1C99A